MKRHLVNERIAIYGCPCSVYRTGDSFAVFPLKTEADIDLEKYRRHTTDAEWIGVFSDLVGFPNEE